MMILALEFSSPKRSVAIFNCDPVRLTTELVADDFDSDIQHARPLPLIQRMLERSGIARESLEAILIGLGPGSYNGIRSAVALAQGWQLARGLKLAGISSVEALAFQAQTRGWTGLVDLVIDAQRNELYIARFQISAGTRELLEPLRLVPVSEIHARAQRGDSRIAGPEAAKWLPQADILFPEAAALGHLLRPSGSFVPGEDIEPIYLRETSFVKAPAPRNIPA
jgi:tRNA threonylcarbamoyladenosine biosynthesis protein TsaB